MSKNGLILLITLATIFLGSKVIYAGLNDGLVAYWSFDNESDAVHDDSGNGHDRTPNGAQWIADGISGGALAFDGVNDYVDIWSSAQLNANVNTSEGSVSVWFKPNNQKNSPPSGFVYQFFGGHGHQDRLYFIYYDDSDGRCAFRIGGGNSVDVSQMNKGGNNWLHVVAVWKSDNTLKLYFNGNLVDEGSFDNPGFSFSGSERFYLGRGWEQNKRYYHGSIDEVRIYNRALSEAEILSLANPCIPANSINFSGYTWEIVHSDVAINPGPNLWSNRQCDVWVDNEGLHLTIKQRDNKWYCTQVHTERSFGYGTYIFRLATELEDRFEGADHPLDTNVVLGLFTWDNKTCETNANSEIDIELARWPRPKVPDGDDRILNYSVQPTDGTGEGFGCESRNNITDNNIIPLELSGSHTTHAFKWTPSNVEFKSYHGHGFPTPYPIGSWVYSDRTRNCRNTESCEDNSVMVGIPSPTADTRVHINLWLYKGQPPESGSDQHVVIKDFKFIPQAQPWIPLLLDDSGRTLINFSGTWSETDGDYGTFTMSFTQTDNSFSGTYNVVKLTHEGGDHSYAISGSRNGNSYQGTDSRGRQFTFELDNSGKLKSGTYFDPDGSETGTLKPQ